MFENSRRGPGVSLAASMEKCGNAHTGMLKTVRSGLASATRRASFTASRLVQTSSRARTTSCPAASSAPAMSSSTSRANLPTPAPSWTKSLPSEKVSIPIFATPYPTPLIPLPVRHVSLARAAPPRHRTGRLRDKCEVVDPVVGDGYISAGVGRRGGGYGEKLAGLAGGWADVRSPVHAPRGVRGAGGRGGGGGRRAFAPRAQ